MADTANGNNERLTFLQVFFPFVVASSKFRVGLSVGWSAVLPKMQTDNSTAFAVTNQDVKWLVSMVGIIVMVCIIAVGPVIEFFGPRHLLLWIHLPSAVSWLILAFTPYKFLLYIGRMVQILITTISASMIPILISELSDPKIRGFMLAMGEITVAMSVLCMYILAQWLHWVIATAICVAPNLLFFVLYLFLPESPYWLARNGRLEEAETLLFRLRSSRSSAADEIFNLTNIAKEKSQTSFLDQVNAVKGKV